jgi:hypothetical protein
MVETDSALFSFSFLKIMACPLILALSRNFGRLDLGCINNELNDYAKSMGRLNA